MRLGSGEQWVCGSTYEPLYLQMRCEERRLAARPDFPEHPHTPDGINTHVYIFTPLPLANPERTDMLSVGWNNIFFVPFSQRHSITPEADSCLRGETEPLPIRSPLSRSIHITLLDRIQRLILLSSSCVILIALWAPLKQLNLVSAVTAQMRITVQSD